MAKKEITGSLANYLPVPGETIEELLESNNLSQADLALRTGLSKKHINQLIKGKKRITIETASKLSNVFTTLNPSFWNNLQRIYDEQIQEIKDKELNLIQNETLALENKDRDILLKSLEEPSKPTKALSDLLSK